MQQQQQQFEHDLNDAASRASELFEQDLIIEDSSNIHDDGDNSTSSLNNFPILSLFF